MTFKLFNKILRALLKDLKGTGSFIDDILNYLETLEDNILFLRSLIERLLSGKLCMLGSVR